MFLIYRNAIIFKIFKKAKEMVLSKKSILALFILCPITAFAHDLVQPVWRGQEGTTYQHWRFDTNENPAGPEVINNPYGQATATITVGELSAGWLDDPCLGQTGIWDLGGVGGSIVLDITNQSSVLEYKEILVQVTYFVGISEAPTVDVPGATFLNEQTILISDDPLGHWDLHQSVWRIYPTPANEQIILISNVSWGSVIDQIVVDTKSATAECIVDFNDLAGFCEQWLWYGSDLEFDLNNSAHVDFKDFSIFANSWLDICPESWPLK